MPDNVLKATIQVTAPGVKETFAQVANSTKAAEGNLNQLGTTVTKTEAVIRQMPPVINETSLTLKDQRVILAALQQQYARLSTEQAKSRIGRELAADIKIANSEIKRLEVGAVSSFGAIGKSATKGFSAIRQLAFILPGIGIAGIFNLAFTAIEHLISGFESLSKKTQLYKEISDQLAKGVAEDLTKLTTLVGLVQNVNTSNDDRVKGLKALNEQYAQYLPNLDKEGITLANVATAYDKIVDALLRQAVVKGLQKEIQAEVEKTAAQIIRFREAEERRRIASEAANKATGDTTTAIQAANQKLQQYNQTVRDGTQALAGRSAELKRNATNFGATSIERLTAELKKQLEPLLNLTTNFEDLDIKLKKVGSEIDKIIAHGKRLAAEFGKLNEIHLEVLPIFSELDTKAEQLKKAQQIIKDVNQFFNDFSSKQRALRLVIPIAPELFIGPIDPKVIDETQAEITRILKEIGPKGEKEEKFDITIGIAVDLDKFKTQLKKDLAGAFNIKITPPDLTPVEKQLLDIQNQAIFAADTISGVLTPAFQGLFDAILSGEDPIKSFFKGLEQAVAQLISKLVAAAVEALVLAAIFGSIGGATGFGAIFAKLLGFEKGGRPPVGKPSVVGEGGHEIFMPDVGKPIFVGVGGPHLFTPERAGKIIPNYKVKDYSKLISTDKVTSVSQSLVSRYSDSTDKVKEISNTISRIVTTVLDKVARFQSTTLDKVASFHSSVSSSFEKVIGWSRNKETATNTTASKEIRYSVISDKELRSDHTSKLTSAVERIINSFSQAKQSDSKESNSKNYKEVFRWASDYFQTNTRFSDSEKLSKSEKSITDNVSKLVSDIFTSQSHKERTGLKEIYKLFSSDVTDNKFAHLTTASTSKELYSIRALKKISSTLAKVFEYSTASTESEKADHSTSTIDKTIHSAFESTYSGLFEKLASVYKKDTSKESKIKDSLVNVRDGKLNKEISRETTKDSKDISTAFQSFIKDHSTGKTTEKNFHSAILSRVQDFVSSKEFSSTFSKDISASEKSFVSLSSDVSRLIEATKSHTHHISEGLSFKSLSTENQSHKANYKEIFSESLLVKLDKKQDKEDKEGKPGKEITNFSAIASVIKSIEWGHDHFREFSVEKVITKSDKSLVHKDLIKEANISDLNELVSHESTSSVKELSKLFASNSQRDSDSSTHTDHSVTTVLESVKSFTSKIVDRFTATIERLLSSVVRMQPIPVSSITNITRAASTLNNLTKNVQFRASGGPVSRNAPTIVGEKGWELFTPKVSGHIIPHHKVNEYLKNLYKNTATEKELKVFRSTRNIKDLNLSKIFNRRITNISELTHKELSTIIGKQFAGFRAGGGFVSAGNSVIVGERQLELFVPNTGASIVTNNNTGGSMTSVQGGALKVEGRIRIAGNDLIAVIANAKRSQNSLS